MRDFARTSSAVGLVLAMAGVWCTPGLARAQAATDEAPLTLEAAFDRAAAANPDVAAARLRQLAATQAVAVARQRPNPDVRVEFERETPTQAYGVAMPVELGGKRSRRIALGTAGVDVSGAETARAGLETHAAVRQTYFAVVAADAKLALLHELRDIATRARDAAQGRFDAGGAPRLEVLQAELAQADAENQATAARGDAEAARARLRALLALPPQVPLALATSIGAGIAEAVGQPAAGVEATQATIAVLDAQLREQRARVALTSALLVPDLAPEATITRGAEPEFSTGWRVALGVTVPLFTRNRAAVKLEEATLGAMTAERNAAATRLAGDRAAAQAVTAALAQQYLRFQSDIVPRAIEVERLAEDAYRLGRTGIAAFLQALQTSRDVRLRMLQTAADFQSARADLERALGAPLP